MLRSLVGSEMCIRDRKNMGKKSLLTMHLKMPFFDSYPPVKPLYVPTHKQIYSYISNRLVTLEYRQTDRWKDRQTDLPMNLPIQRDRHIARHGSLWLRHVCVRTCQSKACSCSSSSRTTTQQEKKGPTSYYC